MCTEVCDSQEDWMNSLNSLVCLNLIFSHVSKACTCFFLEIQITPNNESPITKMGGQIFNNTCLQIMVGLFLLLAHGHSMRSILQCGASRARLRVNGIAHSWARCANEKGSNAFCVWPSSVSVSPLSHRGSIASPVKLLLLMMGQWGLFVIRYYTPPPSHLPFTLQTSIFPWPSKTTPPLSHTGQARLMQLCIINILNKKKGKVSAEIWVWTPPNHHPPPAQPPAPRFESLLAVCTGSSRLRIDSRTRCCSEADKDNRQGHLGKWR